MILFLLTPYVKKSILSKKQSKNLEETMRRFLQTDPDEVEKLEKKEKAKKKKPKKKKDWNFWNQSPSWKSYLIWV